MMELTCDKQDRCSCELQILRIGDTFRYPDGWRTYMRLCNQDFTGQCVALHSGVLYPIDRQKQIIPVDVVATWVDRKSH